MLTFTRQQGLNKKMLSGCIMGNVGSCIDFDLLFALKSLMSPPTLWKCSTKVLEYLFNCTSSKAPNLTMNFAFTNNTRINLAQLPH